MTTRAGVAPVAPWVGVALVLLFALHDQFDLVHTRVLILIGLVVAALGIVHRRRDALSLPHRSPDARARRRRTVIAVTVLLAASVALVLLRANVASMQGVPVDLLPALVPPLLGWSIFLLLPIGLAPARGMRPWEPRLPGSVFIALIAFVAVGLETRARMPFGNIDEVLYTLQAHRFALGHATWALDDHLQRFVKLPMMAVMPGRIHTQYPPGYPAVLALFLRLGLPALCGAAGVLSGLGFDELGERVVHKFSGLFRREPATGTHHRDIDGSFFVRQVSRISVSIFGHGEHRPPALR